MSASISTPEIPRLTSLTREEFVSDYLRPQIPFILTGEACQWPAVGKWDLNHLATTHQEHRVLVEYYPTARRNHAYTYVQMTVGEYIRQVRDNPVSRRRYYLADTAVETALPNVIQDVSVPSIMKGRNQFRTGLFFGWDTFSAMHYHRFREQALLTQITGDKHVVLYPAKHLRHTYAYPWYGLRTNFSRAAMEFDDYQSTAERFPRLAKADEYHCTVQPGEMLFIPDHWMHTVAGPGENISLTYFWPESLRCCHWPGLARDYLASGNKWFLANVARAGKKVGAEELMLKTAISLGVVPEDEREAVQQHLDEFDGKLPNVVKVQQ